MRGPHGGGPGGPGMHGPGMGGPGMHGRGMGHRPPPPPRRRGCMGCCLPFVLGAGGLVIMAIFALIALF